MKEDPSADYAKKARRHESAKKQLNIKEIKEEVKREIDGFEWRLPQIAGNYSIYDYWKGDS